MVAANHYQWSWGGPLPPLARHSQVKHALLREYLVEYFLTLVSSPHQDRIQLTIVDGFCGGGRYTDASGRLVPGSPVVILDAVKEAKARVELEQQRRKPIDFDIKLICVDESQAAVNHLRHVLEEGGHGQALASGKIELLVGDFVELAESIIEEARRRSPLSGRAVFVLDQYGYNAVPLPTLQRIFAKLNRAEVILTFAVDALINYLSEKNIADFERSTGITGAVSAAELDERKKGPNWRLHFQASLYQRITAGSGADYFTPFFIRSEKGHGDFWLLHLSRHWKARDVMATVHWKHHNHFVHYGAAGFDMFSTGYAAGIDGGSRPQAVFEFDDVAEEASLRAMKEQIPKALASAKQGIAFEQFFLDRVNVTPATRDMIGRAVLDLASQGELEILGEDGGVSRVRRSIQASHVLRLPKQIIIDFGR